MRMQGSLVNRMAESSKQIQPEVGMGATELMYSDRHPMTIVGISTSGKTIKVQRDNWKITEGSEQDGSAKYEYTPNPDAPIEEARQDKQGRWKILRGSYLWIGRRERHYDPSF